MNPEIEFVKDGTHVLVNGKEYALPNEITSVKGVPVEMLLLKLKGYSYAEAFRAGTRMLLGNIESEYDVLKGEAESLEKEISAGNFKLALIKQKMTEFESETHEEEQALADRFDHIVAEFVKLAQSVGFQKNASKRAYLAGLDPKLTEDMVTLIYKDSTPAGSVVPAVENIRTVLERYLM